MAYYTLCWMWHVQYLLITIAVLHSERVEQRMMKKIASTETGRVYDKRLEDLVCQTDELFYVSGLSFARKNAHISLPASFPTNLPFWKVVAILDDSGASGGRIVNYRIRRITWHVARLKTRHSAPERFTIDSGGLISLAFPLRDIFNATGHTKIIFVIEVSGEDNTAYDTTLVTVTVNAENNSMCRPRSNICFPSLDIQYRVPESLHPGVIFDTLRPRVTCEKLHFEYRVSEGSNIISVHPTLGDVTLTHSQDAEVKMDRQFKILCHLSNGNKEDAYSMSGVLEVEDVDDNPPYLQPGAQSVVYINDTDINPGRPLPIHLTILDKDSKAVNNVEVRIQNDTLGLLVVQDTSVFEGAFENSMLLHAEIAAIKHFYFPGCWYNFTVVFEDISLSNSSDRKVVFYIHVRNVTASQQEILQRRTIHNVTVYYNASLHSRVFQPINAAEKDGFWFRLESHNTSETVFKITERTGIVYVASRAVLLALVESEIYLTVTWSTLSSDKGECLLIVNVSKAVIEPTLPDCALSCSKSGEKEECTSSCGRGAATARCQWRTNKRYDVPTSHYATCSPDLETCPDGYCDELESMDRWICPQDCTKRVNGQGILDSTSGRGIDRAVGPCTCPEPSTCTCTNHILVINNSLEIESHSVLNHGSTRTPYLVTWSHFPNENQMGLRKSGILFFGGVTSTTACGKGCVSFIFLGVSCSFIGCVVFVLVCRMKKYGSKQKFLGSRMSLYAQPAECMIDDRSSSILDSQAASDCSSSKGLYDAKWEFPRENLLFEKVLGEGEFGKVMRAQAWGIDGSQEYKTVAVKMLKGNGTAAEYQDLLSEFQLLRDIVHPNVIRLLGACTQKGGPLYVIVEYAELGSLRSYLRQCRSLEYDSNSLANPCYDSGYGPADADRSSVEMPHLTQKDLLSFSWQTSKGMAYLSDMKLVHRDLAARNILIASGMVIKISDFGLSRDVYEGDTYLKKSKGPVPVKWMAIESLEDHIYTTRSDVWAFGIVLWEIVTLGASPYPGIVPERLFHLLKAGYRMEKPRNCPDELYRVMRSCWRDSPHDRPSFKDLAQKFDGMLQDMTSYMDFTQESCDTLQSLTSSSSFKDDDTGDEMYGQIKLHNYLGPKKTEQLNYANCTQSSSDDSRVMDAVV